MSELLWLEVCLHLGYSTIRKTVARVSVRPATAKSDALQLVRVAVRDACIFYFKPVKCLQRSAAVTRMLRRRGIRAELVVGYQPAPVESHAWVEVDGKVVWDKMTLHQYLRVIDRL
jgi:hypothetical protein